MDLERELGRLYQLPPGEFTAARDDLAKRLRDEGEREQAEQVKKLRKPPVAVWLVNRLARDRELDVQRLAKAGEALTKSQTGGDVDAFEESRREEQRTLERLSKAAHELSEDEGIGAAAVDRATQTLRAASLTDEGRRLLKQGRLTEELQPPGFEALTGAPRPQQRPAKTQAKTKTDDRAERRRALTEAREALRQLRAEERELRAAVRDAAREADRAESEAARLRQDAEDAAAAAAEAGERIARVEAELEQLR
ncbi:MAG: hypothetical protein ACJ75Q_07035 [Gaiellaceae bacterium]